jgi:hypothetical protein
MTMTMSSDERVMVCVHDEHAPTDAEWDRWIELLRQRVGRDARVFVETRGGGPNAKQRKLLADAAKDLDLRSAVLSDSIVVRGILTAIAWLGVPLRAFSPGEYRPAAEYLGLTQDELQRTFEILAGLRHECFERAPQAATQ